MSSRSRWLIFLVSTPLVVFAAVGGLLGASSARTQEAFPHLRIFEDVVGKILGAYVEPVDADKLMDGAMRGLVDSLDASSAYLSADEVKAIDAGTPLPAGDTGLIVTRQFYLRVVGVRSGSPADRAGLKTGDYIRGIDGKATRELSAVAGTRLLRGAPGSKVTLSAFRGNQAEPREFVLVREARQADPVSAKRLAGGEGYVRIPNFEAGAAKGLRQQIETLQQAGAASAVIDVRGTASGGVDEAVAAARLFVKSGTLTIRAGHAATDRTTIAAAAGDGALTLPIVVLISNGTAGAAEVFAAALSGNHRADLVGQITTGLAAEQHLVRLPDGVGLWMTYQRYFTPDNQPIHERGVMPTVGVDEPFVNFDEPPPATDATLAKGVEHLKAKKAA
jgi:carboxyl-terminal processing protease